MSKVQKWVVIGVLAFLVFVFVRAALFTQLANQARTAGTDSYQVVQNGQEVSTQAIFIMACTGDINKSSMGSTCSTGVLALVNTKNGATYLVRVKFPNGDDKIFDNPVALGTTAQPTVVTDQHANTWSLAIDPNAKH